MAAAHQKWVFILLWVVAAAIFLALYHAAGSNTSNNLNLPGTDSQAANDLLEDQFPPQQNGKNPIVFRATKGKVTDSSNKQAIEQSYKNIKALPHFYSAVDPFSQEGQAQISKDKKTAFIAVLLNVPNSEIDEELAESYLDAAEPARKTGMKVAASGQIGTELSEPETESSEVVGLSAAMVILAFTFGTLVAMGMPIISAVIGLLGGLSLIGLLGHLTTVPTVAPTLGTMIGLGVGIDYALFLVSRYRAEREEGKETNEAIATAVATSGTAIVFAGGTVVIALVSLLVAGIPLVSSLGYASALAVITAVLASITLLPAVLSAVGRHIDSIRVPAFMRPKKKPVDQGFWGAWGRWVTTHPWTAVAITVLTLGILVIPFFALELGQADTGATPKSTTERQAYDYLSSGFGPGYTSPLLVAVKLPTPAKQSSTFKKQYARAQDLQSQLESEQATGAPPGREDVPSESGEGPEGAEGGPHEERQQAQAAEQADLPGPGADRPGEATGHRGRCPFRPGEGDRRGAQAEPDAGARPGAQGGQDAGERDQGRGGAAEGGGIQGRRRGLCDRFAGGQYGGRGRGACPAEEPAHARGGRRPGNGSAAPDPAGPARGAPAAGRDPAAAGGEAPVHSHRGPDRRGRRQARDGSATGQPPERPQGDGRSPGRFPAGDQQVGAGGDLQRSLEDRPGRRGDRGPGHDDSRLRDPPVDPGDWNGRARWGIDRVLRRPGGRHLVQARTGDLHGHRTRLRRPADGVPVGCDPRSSRLRERLLGLRGLRRRHRLLSVGVGAGRDRHRHDEQRRPDRELRPTDHVRGALRALDGLPGVPDEPDRARSRQVPGRPPQGDRRRPRRRRPGDQRGSPDHDRRVRQLHPERRPDREAVRGGALGRCRTGGPHGDDARAGAAGSGGQGGHVVGPEVDGPRRPAHRHRGRDHGQD